MDVILKYMCNRKVLSAFHWYSWFPRPLQGFCLVVHLSWTTETEMIMAQKHLAIHKKDDILISYRKVYFPTPPPPPHICTVYIVECSTFNTRNLNINISYEMWARCQNHLSEAGLMSTTPCVYNYTLYNTNYFFPVCLCCRASLTVRIWVLRYEIEKGLRAVYPMYMYNIKYKRPIPRNCLVFSLTQGLNLLPLSGQQLPKDILIWKISTEAVSNVSGCKWSVKNNIGLLQFTQIGDNFIFRTFEFKSIIHRKI